MKFPRQTFLILSIAVALSVGWTVALRVLPRPALAETNYEANRLRLENWLLGPVAPAVLVGTSLSGRLLPDYFAGTALAGIANLGLDGASPDTGLRLVLQRVAAPRRIFLEVHLLAKPPGPNDRQLLDLAAGVGLQISRYLPLTRADARPSTVLYGWLKERQGPGSESGNRPEESSGKATPAVARAVNPQTPAAADSNWRPRLLPLLNRLRERGSEVILVRLPTGRDNPVNPEATHGADAIAGELGLPMIDLLSLSRQRGLQLTYTDGLHLTPTSAREVARLLAESVASESAR